jgi:hypothetical protein
VVNEHRHTDGFALLQRRNHESGASPTAVRHAGEIPHDGVVVEHDLPDLRSSQTVRNIFV